MTPQEFFDSIDYQQLVFQKEMLHNAIIDRADDTDDTKAEALLAMIDALQDTAAEIYGEEKVFFLTKRDQYLERYREYLSDNRLDDDSKWISTEDLFHFVDNEIGEEE